MSGPYCASCKHFHLMPLSDGGGECTDPTKRIFPKGCGDPINAAPWVRPDMSCANHESVDSKEGVPMTAKPESVESVGHTIDHAQITINATIIKDDDCAFTRDRDLARAYLASRAELAEALGPLTTGEWAEFMDPHGVVDVGGLLQSRRRKHGVGE